MRHIHNSGLNALNVLQGKRFQKYAVKLHVTLSGNKIYFKLDLAFVLLCIYSF